MGSTHDIWRNERIDRTLLNSCEEAVTLGKADEKDWDKATEIAVGDDRLDWTVGEGPSVGTTGRYQITRRTRGAYQNSQRKTVKERKAKGGIVYVKHNQSRGGAVEVEEFVLYVLKRSRFYINTVIDYH